MRLYLSSFGLGDHPEELLNLLRGGKRVAVVLNAKDGSSLESRTRSLHEEMAALTALGLEPKELDLRNYVGHLDVLAIRLERDFDLLWVRGGNVFVLRRIMRMCELDEILSVLLDNDQIVYGGFSAAACVLAPSLRGYEIVDDPNILPDEYDEGEPIWNGLDILPYAIAPHYRSDHPESDAIGRLVEHFSAVGVPYRTMSDGQAIVIDRDETRSV